MKFYRTCKLAVWALRRNILRAALTTLGIVIGVAAVIAMMEIGHGSAIAIQRTIASMGANNLLVMPGTAASGGVTFGAGSKMTLTPQDADAIEQECPAVGSVAPVVRARTQVVYGNRNWVPLYIYGTTPTFLPVRNWTDMAAGDPFTERDVRSYSQVCLIGQTLVRELFGGQSPIGKEIRVQNVSFKVIGVLQNKGANMMGMDQDDILLAPWTTIKYRVVGASLTNQNQSSATSQSTASSDQTSSQVNTLNQIYPNTQQSLYPIPSTMRDMTEITNTVSSTTALMTKLLLGVAMISLVVGGVGIMNIMLVSVTERTREIGLRMAVGAEPGDILRQFLSEAVVLCLIGGVVGIVLGRGSSYLVTLLLHWPTAVSVEAIVAAVVVSATVGILFGYYPAWKASRLDPIDALRYE